MAAENPINFPDEPVSNDTYSSGSLLQREGDVSPLHIFKLAKQILIVSSVIFVTFALLRIFHPFLEYKLQSNKYCSSEGIKEVWDYSKVALNSIVSLVLGLYFGSKHSTEK